MTEYRRSVKYDTSQFQFLTQLSLVLMQFVYHIRKDIDIVGLICHLFGLQIGAVIIPSPGRPLPRRYLQGSRPKLYRNTI